MLRTVLDSGCKGMKELEGEGIKKGSDKKKKKKNKISSHTKLNNQPRPDLFCTRKIIIVQCVCIYVFACIPYNCTELL